MVLDHLEVENSSIFWAYAPGPPEDIADLMIVDHRSTKIKNLPGLRPLIPKEIAEFMVLDQLEVENSTEGRNHRHTDPRTYNIIP